MKLPLAALAFATTALGLSSALTGCGVGPTVGGGGAVGPPREYELVAARPAGARGPLVAYDPASGRERFRLPAGMVAADGSAYYATVANTGETTLSVFDPRTGALTRRFALNGDWEVRGVSPTGRWVALAHPDGPRNEETELEIVDAERTEVAHVLRLDGEFEVETISADGHYLFLVNYLPSASDDRYLIRLYDLSEEELLVDPLRAKGPDEIMSGLAWGGLASPDGRWLFTLYLNTTRNVAFVHALDLVRRQPACIDLPSGTGDLGTLKAYTLALAPDGRTLYAANALLGVVAEINLASLPGTRVTRFEPRALRAVDPRSVVSPDGARVFFSAGEDVWGFDAVQETVTGPFETGRVVTGLGVSPDGRRLYVAGDGQPLVALDAS